MWQTPDSYIAVVSHSIAQTEAEGRKGRPRTLQLVPGQGTACALLLPPHPAPAGCTLELDSVLGAAVGVQLLIVQRRPGAQSGLGDGKLLSNAWGTVRWAHWGHRRGGQGLPAREGL